LARWIKKEDPTICCLQETYLIDRNKHWLRVKRWRRCTKTMAPKAGRGSNTYLGQNRLKLTSMKQDKEGHSILIKAEVQQKKITIINL
jgi:hypothetical protein